jgi:hypothetical protein
MPMELTYIFSYLIFIVMFTMVQLVTFRVRPVDIEDHHVGRKILLHMFLTLSLFLLTFGLCLLCYCLVDAVVIPSIGTSKHSMTILGCFRIS